MRIENCAADDINKAFHHDAGSHCMLIQLMDPDAGWWPVPKHTFTEVHQFSFLDVENTDEYPEDVKISDKQAAELVRLLHHALASEMNVVVHCYAGICRSGAVVEVGSMMGIEPVEKYRQPNILVKHKMMKVLGWTYDENEERPDHWRNYDPWAYNP